MKALVIEDDQDVANYLVKGLKESDFVVDHAADGKEGMMMAASEDYDIMIVDRMLPGMDGLSIIKTVRATGNQVPVLILSALGDVDDRVEGLRGGGDDYLTKPFSFDELHVRLLCLMRRGSLNVNDNTINIGMFSLDLHLKQLFCDGVDTNLTPNEYKLVECLFSNQGKVISPEKLSEYLAGQYDAIAKNSIEAHLSTARKKVKSLGYDLPIKTKRGFGYFC